MVCYRDLSIHACETTKLTNDIYIFKKIIMYCTICMYRRDLQIIEIIKTKIKNGYSITPQVFNLDAMAP